MPGGAGGWSAGANSRAEAKQDSLHVHNFKSGSGPACQLSPASPAQPAPLLPSLHFLWKLERERREKLYWEIDCSTYTCASSLHSESG